MGIFDELKKLNEDDLKLIIGTIRRMTKDSPQPKKEPTDSVS